MTRAELHNTPGFHPDTVRAVAAFMRANLPRKARAADPTQIINHEGWMNGYLDAVEDIIGSTKPESEQKPKGTFQPYSQPHTQNENQKR